MDDRPHEIAIAGGGLAGLCLALQLKQADPSVDVVVLERDAEPAPDAAHKVGESSVEIGSQYFTEVLGLRDLLEDELPKFGLRFFFSHGDNRDIAQRFELGPSHFLHVPSYQIDRGHFENALVERCRERGVEVRRGAAVRSVELGEGDAPHRLGLAGGATLRCRWLVDASGRAGLLKRAHGLAAKNAHLVNASWFRVDHPIDLDRWSDEPSFRTRVSEPRRLSTNHLMGEGYWAWIIPLRGDRTSVGICADDAVHPWDEIRTAERALEWLERHEPQLAEKLAPHLDRRMDFRTLRGYSHDCRQVLGDNRWFITGEAGVFSDPLYSPGSDFIAISNLLIGDLILRERAGEDVAERRAAFERTFASLHRTVTTIYRGQYPIMGNPRVMSFKILWDFTMYWAGLAPLARNRRIEDPDFMSHIADPLLELAALGLSMQRFLRKWSRLDPGGVQAGGFFDYAEVPYLAELNRALLGELDRPTLLSRQARNLTLIRELDREIRAYGAATVPALAAFAKEAPPSDGRLEELRAALKGEPSPAAEAPRPPAP